MSLMPTSRRASKPSSLGKLVAYSSALADPVTVEVEEALTPENEGEPAGVEEVTLTPGSARWSGIIGFENEFTGDGRVISEGALRWPEDLSENPIPIRYVSSDVGAHDGAQVVGLIDTIERLPADENGSIPIWGEGVFDDADEAVVAQEAFRHVEKKMTNGVSMDLDDVVFEVENDAEHGDRETVRTNDARIRAVTIVAIPAFAGARIGITPLQNAETAEAHTAELAAAAEGQAAEQDVEEENPRVVVSTNSARGMKAHAVTKARLKRLASRSTAFAYQTTKIKDPEGNWVETPAAAIDVASNSTPPDDSFQKGLDILNEADMLELGSEEYLAKVREAVPLFEEALDDGGDRGPDSKKVLEILEEYLAIDWPPKNEDGELIDENSDSEVDATDVTDVKAPGENDKDAPVEQKAAAATDTLASEVSAGAAFAFNPDQWRNPHNGQWIDMPGRILGRLEAFFADDESETGSANREKIDSAKQHGDVFVEHLNEGDIESALSEIDAIQTDLADVMIDDMPEPEVAEDALTSANDKLDDLKQVDWFSATPSDDGGVGSFEDPEAESEPVTEAAPAADPRAAITEFIQASGREVPQEVNAFFRHLNAGDYRGTADDRALLWQKGNETDDEDEKAFYNELERQLNVIESERLGETVERQNQPAPEAEMPNPSMDSEDAPEPEPETAIEEGRQFQESLELDYDQDLPDETATVFESLEADDLEAAEKALADVQKLLQDAQEGYQGDDDTEGEARINFLDDVIDGLSRTIDRWKSEKSYNEGRDFAYDPEQALAWAKEFNVPDAQVEEMLQTLATVEIGSEEWDELSSASQGFVKLSRAGVDVKESLAIYLRTLEEMGHGSVEITYGAKRGQVFNWVDEVGGLPKYIRDIADSLMKRGFAESRAIATAVETVKRWAKGGPARKGGKGSVSAKTVAKAVKALAEWEAKKARANATAAETTVLSSEPAAVTASGGWGTPFRTTQERAHSDEVAGRRQDLLAQVRGEDVVAEAEAITAAASGNAVATRPIVKLNSKSRIPVAPPKEWFENPMLREATPITVDDDGRVYGHIASWNVCHVASPAGENICIMAPKSQTGYAYFHTGAVKTAEGNTVATGRLCMNGTHADTRASYTSAMAHYDNSSLAVADVRCGEDRFGIWVAGAMRPDVTPAQMRAFRASPLSGDWRKIGGRLEMTIGLSVNAPGYPVPRPMGLVASVGGVDSEAADHELISLVAAGMLAPKKVLPQSDPQALSVEDLKYLKTLAMREKNEQLAAEREEVLAKAGKLAAQRNRAKVAAFAAKRNTNTDTEGTN
ncbi:hypothetical protein PBI_DEWDROP_58 [Microbacterium phage Dewdrop]|nr:hypothetical protein PBI_LEAF_58 [Microbacterium phage Leaf]QGZ17427.1 hypothetical protein PBI_DEWDROP_58 [Microbacterium phage Dewdrop]